MPLMQASDLAQTSTSELHHEVQSGIFWIRAASMRVCVCVVVVVGRV